MNIVSILNVEADHDLMHYSFWLTYLVAPALLARVPSDGAPQISVRTPRAIAAVFTALIIWSGVQTANVVYLKKAFLAQSTLSQMTRVAEDLSTVPTYQPGITPVVFYSAPEGLPMAGFDTVDAIVGVGHNSLITYDDKTFNGYFRYYLDLPMNARNSTEYPEFSEQLNSLPAFPDVGYIDMVDGVLLVRLS